MNTLNFLMSLFNSGRRTQQMFKLFRNRRNNNRSWIWFSLLGLGTVFSVVATRNSNMMNPIQRLFQGVQNTTKTFIPSKVNLTNVEFADEIMPNSQKKPGNQNQ
ncbi:hypothetical protein COE15_21960 [Bacillus cereus]|uniref:Uncharacterized protein n=1 Tax=Bacillus arachidis TaxID=2819290 RepID=A0ABS3NXF1_9BACI|nr:MULTISPECIES: hypothetical protein [Bacillus]MBO1625540.1 hypothetical protein [Bacillus arachidis]PFD98447.1 hypothetical protein CN288_21025 [Bacillus sp. AFS023182]PGX94905.1 hypothetical protein COE15_21960 [Bacillus cereus]SDY84983.1 hypothetical protein SAMN04488156_102719 [Bacillus sp. 166amftsu]